MLTRLQKNRRFDVEVTYVATSLYFRRLYYLHCECFCVNSSSSLPLPFSFYKSQVGPQVRTVGAMARRVSPLMTRCSLSLASEATPARPPKNPTILLQPRPPLHPLRKWISLALMGRTLTPGVLHLSPRRLLPQPLTSWGTCSGGHRSQPVGPHLPSPHHIKSSQTLPRLVHLLHRQVRLEV